MDYYDFSYDEDDEPFHISQAEEMVMADPKYFPQNGKEPIKMEEVRKVVEKLRKTNNFKGEPESIFVDDITAPPRGTEEYRQWFDYHSAKGHYDLLGYSPHPNMLDKNGNVIEI